jgi:acyl carrier protein
MEELIRILEEVRPDLDFDKEKTLIDSGVLDSFDIITMVGEINDTFGIEINVADLLPENFNSKETIWELIELKREGK